MNSTKIEKSPRLQRVLEVLRHSACTTREIIERAHVCAVNSCIAELRDNGYDIETMFLGRRDGVSIYQYTLLDAPEK